MAEARRGTAQEAGSLDAAVDDGPSDGYAAKRPRRVGRAGIAAAGGGEEREVALTRRSDVRITPYRQGEPFRLLTPKIGYVDLEKLTNAQVGAMFDAFKGTHAIVMDMRGYPQGTAWSIAPRLAEKRGDGGCHVPPQSRAAGGVGGQHDDADVPAEAS